MLLSNSFLYDEQKVILYQHNVMDEKDNLKTYRFWTHFYNEDDLISILERNGFEKIISSNDVLPGTDLWSGENVTFFVSGKSD